MQDPKPENITGAKRFNHTLKWEINVAHTIFGLLALFVAWKLFAGVSFGSSADGGEQEGVEIDVAGETPNTMGFADGGD